MNMVQKRFYTNPTFSPELHLYKNHKSLLPCEFVAEYIYLYTPWELLRYKGNAARYICRSQAVSSWHQHKERMSQTLRSYFQQLAFQKTHPHKLKSSLRFPMGKTEANKIKPGILVFELHWSTALTQGQCQVFVGCWVKGVLEALSHRPLPPNMATSTSIPLFSQLSSNYLPHNHIFLPSLTYNKWREWNMTPSCLI